MELVRSRETPVYRYRNAGIQTGGYGYEPDFDSLVFCKLFFQPFVAELHLHEKASKFAALLLGRTMMSGVPERDAGKKSADFPILAYYNNEC